MQKCAWSCRGAGFRRFVLRDYLVYGYVVRFVGQGCFFRLWLIRSTAPVLHTVFSAKCKIIFHKDLAFFAVHCCVRRENGRIKSLSKKPKVRDAWICSWSGPGRFCVLTNGRVIWHSRSFAFGSQQRSTLRIDRTEVRIHPIWLSQIGSLLW